MKARWISLASVLLPAILSLAHVRADTLVQEWDFTSSSHDWVGSAGFDQQGVGSEGWWGTTTGTVCRFESTSVLGVPVPNQPEGWRYYVSIKMRISGIDSVFDARGQSPASLYYIRNGVTEYSEELKRTFRVYGNDEWKTYNIWMGQRWFWIRSVNSLRLEFQCYPGSRVEIQSIRIMKDETPPASTLHNLWNPRSGDTIRDTTPTVNLKGYHDLVAGITHVEFYSRRHPQAEWVLQGSDDNAQEGYRLTYPTLPAGTYDFGVRAYDKAGNIASWENSSDAVLEAVTINPSAETTISVDAGATRGAVPRKIFGSNLNWLDMEQLYDPQSGLLMGGSESLLADLGVTILRYPGGCLTDTFYWKETIGPYADRIEQDAAQCSRYSTDVRKPLVGLDEFLRFCERRGIEPMVIVRFRWPGGPEWDPSPGFQPNDGPDPFQRALDDARDLVEYCNAPNDGSHPWAAERARNGHPEPYNVRMFEIGNEPYDPDPFGSPGLHMLGTLGRSVYAKTFRVFEQAMKEVDPDIVVSAQTRFGEGDLRLDDTTIGYMHDLMQEVAQHADVIAGHPYMPRDGVQTDMKKLYTETMATGKNLDDDIDQFHRILHLAAPERVDDLKLRISEWQISYNYWLDLPVPKEHTRTLKAAIAAADAYRIMLENKDLVQEACWYYLYGPTAWATFHYTPFPFYHVHRAFRKHFGETLVESSVAASPVFDYVKDDLTLLRTQYDLPRLTAIASRSDDGRSLYLIVINNDDEQAHQARMELAGFLEEQETLYASIWTINGPDVDDYSIPSTVSTQQSSLDVQHSFTYTFPAHSVTSFRFTTSQIEDHSGGTLEPLLGHRVRLIDRVVSAVFQDEMYVQDLDRTAGVKVKFPDVSASIGNLATITGVVSRDDGEIYIQADEVAHDDSALEVRPLALRPQALRVTKPGTTGLLVKTWGVVASRCEDSFFIEGLLYSQCSQNKAGTRVYADIPPEQIPKVGEYVVVTGIHAVESPAGYFPGSPVIRTRNPLDVEGNNPPGVVIPDVTVGRNLQRSLDIELPSPPAVPISLTVTSDDPDKVLIAPDAQAPGVSSIVFDNVTSTNVGTIWVQGVDHGVGQLSTSAPGYATTRTAVSVSPSAIIIFHPAGITTNKSAAPTEIRLHSVRLNPGTLEREIEQPIRGGLNLNVDLMLSNASVGSISPNPLTFQPDTYIRTAQFSPLDFGMTDIVVQQPEGFTDPASGSQITAVVNAVINATGATVGNNLQTTISVNLATSPAGPTDVTLTSQSPDLVALALSPEVEGTTSVTLTGVTGTESRSVYVQGRSLGTTGVRVSAPGYNDTLSYITVNPSAFIFMQPASITTTLEEADTNIVINSVRLNPATMRREIEQPIRGGLTVDVGINSVNPSAGTVSSNPVTFGPNEYTKTVSFHPQALGATVLTTAPPAGFSQATALNALNVSVLGSITVPYATLGKNLQRDLQVVLSHAPAAPVDVTITSNDTSKAIFSLSPTTAGSSSVVLQGVTSANAGTVYIQGLETGVSSFRVTAEGFKNRTQGMHITPSGFVLLTGDINTSLLLGNRPVTVAAARLNPTTLKRESDQPVRGGLEVNVPIYTLNPLIGIMLTNPLQFSGGETTETSIFQPLIPGDTTLRIDTPPGFSTPSEFQQIPVRVGL